MLRTLCFHCCGPRVRSLVRELKPYKLHGVAKKKKENMRFGWGKNLWLGQVPGCKSWLLRLARGGLRSATRPSSCVTVQNKTCHLIRWLCWEDPLEKGTATHSSTLAWRIPWTEEPCGLLPMGSQRVVHDWVTNAFIFTFSWLWGRDAIDHNVMCLANGKHSIASYYDFFTKIWVVI